ncbi:hybrid sensor histidine kinase/response regulator [Chitinophaga parva]|uniref:histidine kinase n=2 Tax=Chitinophaga parva TaxID=2169414 RepID=A0A2T7BI55_9BACT|nr:hybrid sensor histidine kinase/response regulator [Chitinophaga parva]
MLLQVFTCLCLVTISPAAFAQLPTYQFTRIDINQGLSAGQVNCILKDDQGFLWVGTVSGLNRYDGVHFQVFHHAPRDSSTLSSSFISTLEQGPGGRLWVTTFSGQDVYDPRTETFRRNAGAVQQAMGLDSGTVRHIVRDYRGWYWYLLPQAGLQAYDPATGKVFRLRAGKDSIHLLTNDIANLGTDARHHYWVLHTNGVLEDVEPQRFRVVKRYRFLPSAATAQHCALLIDHAGDCWIYNPTGPAGVYRLQTSTGQVTLYQTGPGPTALNNNIVRGVVEDDQGQIWIGTDHGGINVLDITRTHIRYVQNNPEDPKSLSQNSINALYRDSSGMIWVGTYKRGLNYYHEHLSKFALYQHQPYNPQSLPYDDVNRFVEDAKGNLWIGTNGGGLLYFDRQQHRFTQYRAGMPEAPGSNVIVSLCMDHAQKLWIGSYFGGLDCFDGKHFTHYANDPRVPDNSIWELYEDRQKRLWIGTLGHGLCWTDSLRKDFHLVNNDPLHLLYISTLLEDKAGNLWIGGDKGLEVLQPDGRFKVFTSNPGSLSDNLIICLFEDSRGWIWAGTREGLNLYDPQQQRFRVFRKEDGLPDNAVLNILEDGQHQLWMSTTNGLSALSIQLPDSSFTFRNYGEADGLQGKEFNENAALKTRAGELIFGGGNGFNLFYPDNIAANKQPPRVVFTDFQIFNSSVHAGEIINGRVLLPQAMTQTQSITLRYRENVFSISFAALNFLHPEKNRYRYKLEGFNTQWLSTDALQQKITYTNLDPGDYTFRVMAANNDGIWNEQGATLHIKILPPFWRTPLAFLLYALAVIGALLLARYYLLEKERFKFRLERERQEAQRMHEMDALKLRFFTNISHEFRTPLSLILSPVEKLLRHAGEQAQKTQLELVQRNARRLLNLVNQLLDFRKLEVEPIKLHPAEADIISFLQELTVQFSDLSEKKQVGLQFHSNLQTLTMLYDADKLEKILFNLLSNAFKFTPAGGRVSVTVSLVPGEGGEPDLLQLQVKDTGIGIPAEQQERIFERFFQHDVPASMVNPGSGIGLSITREFVRLHQGRITVESAPDQGATFTVWLPVHTLSQAAPVSGQVHAVISAPEGSTSEASGPAGNKPLLLLVEDNEDFRFYLKDNLRQYFRIAEAGNGQDAWEQLQNLQPDLVISDVSMPLMDGLQLCAHIRKQPRTAHLPVILLTARAAEGMQLEALESGATEYVTKPFNYEVLLSRIRNIIQRQQALSKHLHPHPEVDPVPVSITTQDERFRQAAMQVIEAHLSDPGFSVEELSQALFMSRVSVYKKLLAVTGMPPLEFIRSLRMKRAAQLLKESQLTVAEVAYEVGFNNPKNFSRYFKIAYHMLPSQYQKRQAGTTPEPS